MSADHERSITVGLLGSNHEITKLIGESLGTPGTKSDLQFYNRLDSHLGMIFTAVAPIGYPDKVKTLIQTCAETKLHIMVIDAETGITPEIGEIMVLMDLFAHFYGSPYLAAIGGITSQNEWRVEEIKQKLPKLTAATVLKDIEVFTLKIREDFDNLKKRICDITRAIPEPDYEKIPYSKVLIDHVFPVRGVGTVALGLVSQGQIHAGKMYDLVPIHSKIILRSIQKFDRDFKTAEEGDRVGLALKGVRSEEIDRNVIFCSLNSMNTSDQATVRLYVSPYYKPQSENGMICPGDPRNYHAVVDLGISPAKLLSGDEIKPGKDGMVKIKLEKALVHDEHGLRGILADFGPFDKKLRIIGFFKQE